MGLLETGGITGRELNLYQVTRGLERSSRPESERLATIELQRKIQDAVVTGPGWERIDIPEVDPAAGRYAVLSKLSHTGSSQADEGRRAATVDHSR